MPTRLFENAFSRVCLRFIIDLSVSRVRVERKALSTHCAAALRSLIRRHMPLRRLVGDIKGVFQKQLLRLSSLQNVFLAQNAYQITLFFWRFQKRAFSKPPPPPNQKQFFAFYHLQKITLKGHLETLIHQKK